MSLLDPNSTFSSLGEEVGLDVRLQKAVSRLGLVRPTLVQRKCLPLAILEGRDLLVRARTGSGKTLAYCLPLLQKILSTPAKQQVCSVVLCPTRELCTQVANVLETLVYYAPEVTIQVLVGSDTQRQEAMLRDVPQVVVGTPAGILTHVSSGVLSLDSVETFIVDEADLVLSFGYANDVSQLIKALPKICQGFLMSATLSPELEDLKRVVLHSPAVLKLEEEEEEPKADGKLTQFYLEVPKKDKFLVLYVFLKLGLLKGKGLFFVHSTDGAYRFKLFLEQFHIRSAVLNGELPLHSRLDIVEQYNIGNFDYLIATDHLKDHGEEKSNKKKKKGDEEYGVSRGLDFRNVSFVVNVDFPTTAQSYTHRVGRTARGGAKGVALSLVEAESTNQQELLTTIQQEQPVASSSVAAASLPTAAAADTATPETQKQPMPLDFDLQELEGFRYRVEDVSRAVTRTAVRETRAAELVDEILNSQRLQNTMEGQDLNLLRHDRIATHVAKVQPHLKHVPKYMLPRGMQVADLNKKRKRRRHKNRRTDGRRRTDNDPLQSYDDTLEEEDDDDDGFAEFFEDADEQDSAKVKKTESKVVFHTQDGTGKSTSGRNAWKEKHRKGKFSGKRRKSEAPRRKSGI